MFNTMVPCTTVRIAQRLSRRLYPTYALKTRCGVETITRPSQVGVSWIDRQMSTSNNSASDSQQHREKKGSDKEEQGAKYDATSEGDSFQEAVNRMRGKNGKADDNGKTGSSNTFLRGAAGVWSRISDEVGLAWKDIVQSGERQSINKKIYPVETAAGDAPYTGPVDLMTIDPSENLTAWERMQKRLAEAPIIQDMLSRSEEYYEKSGAKKVKERLDEIKEDAREAWETSQNPWVYRVSSVYDTLTAESPETRAVKELRELDPEFTLEGWRRDVVEHTLPQIMQWFLEGRINQLKDWCGEAVFQRVAAEIMARKKEGVEIDTHVLGIMNSEILSVEPDTVERGSPIILLHFMVQQINCVRKKADGTIVEGSEDDIRANSYVAAFQREFREEKGELVWKIVDFRFNGAIAYL